LAEPTANPAGLGSALDWAMSGWPNWLLYQPIAEAVFRSGLVKKSMIDVRRIDSTERLLVPIQIRPGVGHLTHTGGLNVHQHPV
jgi:hypothetical protein